MNAASRYSMPSVIGLVIMPSCFVPSILSNPLGPGLGFGIAGANVTSQTSRPSNLAA
jgi:hypothetical protein